MATGTDYARSVSVSKLTGRDVLDYDGNKIGDLDEIVLDMSSGCVDFAIVSFGGFLGIGEKHYIIPQQALHYDPEQGMFRMDVTQSQVEQAPGFARGNWPNYNDDAYMQSVFSYWGAERGQATWQRPWDPEYRAQHPEMYTQAGQASSTGQGDTGAGYSSGSYAGGANQVTPGQTKGAEYVAPGGSGVDTGTSGGYPGADQGYTSGGTYSGPERRQGQQYRRRSTDNRG